MIPVIEKKAFPEPYQYKTDVAPGESVTIYLLKMFSTYAGFIENIACSWWENTYYEFRIDGRLEEKIERSIPFATPYKYDTPLIVEKKVEWIFVNNGTVPRDPDVLCQGTIARQI